MKQTDIPNFEVDPNDFATLFNVYEQENGDYYFNMLRTINFLNTDNMSPAYYFTYMVEDGDTWPLIAYAFYGNTTIWWIICKFNNIQNPIDFPKPGTILKMPNQDLIDSILNDIAQA